MEFARQYVDDFSDLFRGNQTSHGVHIPEKNPKEGEKAKGSSFVRHERLTQDHILKHLHGEESIGVNPLDAQGNLRFAAIDVDVYPLNPKRYLKILKRANLPAVGFKSKSGGLHLFFFFAQDSEATKVVPMLKEIVQLLGLPSDTEVFPKQTRLVGKQTGNWINLPYFKYQETTRHAYDIEGEKLSLREALALARDSRITIKTLRTTLDDAPLASAPPCLQTIYLAGGPAEGGRNMYLFNCATYLKAKHEEDFSVKLHELNAELDKPVGANELEHTIISSHNKGDYSYQCNEGVLKDFCCKELCNGREFGKGAGLVSDLSFEKLIQVNAATPYYKWIVNGAEMLFYSETDLLNQNKFRELCLRLLHKVPNRLKDNAWNAVLNRALENLEIEEVSHFDDLSEDSLWMSKILEFFSRRSAVRPSQIEDGLVWHTESNHLVFKGAKLIEYLDKTGLFRHFKKTQHRHMLKKLGAKNDKFLYSDLDKTVRVWKLDILELNEKGLFLDLYQNDIDEDSTKKMTPIDFIGDEQF